MGHEISQFAIPDRQLLASNTQPRMDMRTDIGEAKITRTIFGGAKVRVVREQDKKRRAWLLTALAGMALAVAGWQVWISLQQAEPLAAPPPPLSERIRVSLPVFQPEDVAQPATSSSARSKSRTPTQIVLDSMTTRREPPPQQPAGLKTHNQMAAKPVTAQPLTTGKPQAASLAANSNAPKNQTDMHQPPRLSAPIQPAASTDAAPSATQPTPAAIAPLAAPMVKEAPAQTPAGNNQPSDPVNVQPPVNAQP